MTTNLPKENENEIVSLESSLSAETEAESIAPKEKFPTWIYYYLAFLGLLFTLAILGMINTSRPEDPMLLTLHEVPKKFASPEPTTVPEEVESATEEPQPVVVEASSKKIEVTKEDPKPTISLLDDPLFYYPTYSPDDLRKAFNKLQTIKNKELDVVRAEVYSLLGWYEGQPKFKADGLAAAAKAVKANPQDFRANRDLALANYLSNQLDQARHYHHLINGKLFDSLTKWIAAMIASKTINAQTITAVEQIRKADINFFPASYTLIQEYLKQNQLAKAREIVEFWRDKSLTSPAFVHLVAELLDRQQQYVELIYYLNSFEKVYPKDWLILFHLAKANQKLQKRDLAKSYFQRILDHPENFTVEQIGSTYFEFGKLHLLDEKPKEAVQNLYQASQRLPNDQNVKFYLASAYYKNDDFEKAIEVYQQMIVTEKYDPKIRIYIGMAYFEAGQYRLAEKNLMVSLNQGYRDPLLLYYLAKIEEQRGNLPKTRDYLQQILSVDPNYIMAKKMLEKLNAPVATEAKQTR